ncbi:hypothetical protein TI39_contig1051g00022 [Zymoseptoria brevis]|uniref:Uncharacterized protein n=1 Tax=Zymoseptoria brevis TaxID=1047168 RepID=A0A0F4GEB4_9PEZI|nr:hypothetical protein TI39_contig1051g00022 [Zymoseptoria brevis]
MRRAKGEDDDMANEDDSDEKGARSPGEMTVLRKPTKLPLRNNISAIVPTRMKKSSIVNSSPSPAMTTRMKANQQASQVDLGPTPDINELRDRALQLMWDITHLEASQPEDGDLRLAAEYQAVTCRLIIRSQRKGWERGGEWGWAFE